MRVSRKRAENVAIQPSCGGVDALGPENLQYAVGQVVVVDVEEPLAEEAVEREFVADDHVRQERRTLSFIERASGWSLFAEQPGLHELLVFGVEGLEIVPVPVEVEADVADHDFPVIGMAGALCRLTRITRPTNWM